MVAALQGIESRPRLRNVTPTETPPLPREGQLGPLFLLPSQALNQDCECPHPPLPPRIFRRREATRVTPR